MKWGFETPRMPVTEVNIYGSPRQTCKNPREGAFEGTSIPCLYLSTPGWQLFHDPWFNVGWFKFLPIEEKKHTDSR